MDCEKELGKICVEAAKKVRDNAKRYKTFLEMCVEEGGEMIHPTDIDRFLNYCYDLREFHSYLKLYNKWFPGNPVPQRTEAEMNVLLEACKRYIAHSMKKDI